MTEKRAPTLRQLASVVRSKNAGAFLVTIDVMFDDDASYERVCRSGVLSADRIGTLLGVVPQKVRITHFAVARTIKASVPRLIAAGHPMDTDILGSQQYGPLVDLPIPDAAL